MRPMNYSQSIIYKIACRNAAVTDIYIGSTCSFRARKCQHKNACTNENRPSYNLKIYQFIRENGGWQNFDMIQIEQYAAADKRSLHSRERFWIEQLQPSLNSEIPTRTAQEWRQDNREAIKQYYQANREAIAAKGKQYYRDKKDLQTCICGSDYNYGTSDHRKKHYRTQKHQAFVSALWALLNPVEG